MYYTKTRYLNEMRATDRIVWVDISKGIGILLVVIGHVQTLPLIHDSIFLFHMPLFFLLSGFFFKIREPWRVCIQKKVIRLLLPVLFFMAIFIPLRYITDYFCLGYYPPFRISMLGISYFDKPLWFIFALFDIIVILQTLFSTFSNKKVIYFIVSLSSIIGYFLLLHKYELPFHFSRALFLLPFFTIGIWAKKIIADISLLSVLCSLLFVILGIYGIRTGHICLDILKMQVDANPLYAYFPAIGGTILVIFISKYISLQKNSIIVSLRKLFIYLGCNSFYIFAVHHPVILFIQVSQVLK